MLLESGNPNLSVKQLGGTGRTHHWQLSREIVESVNVPVYLAGGLNELNVGDEVSKIKPFGLDLCSSLRTDDQLDLIKLPAFIESFNKKAADN